MADWLRVVTAALPDLGRAPGAADDPGRRFGLGPPETTRQKASLPAPSTGRPGPAR